jgi:flagellar biosynthetic protein FliP
MTLAGRVGPCLGALGAMAAMAAAGALVFAAPAAAATLPTPTPSPAATGIGIGLSSTGGLSQTVVVVLLFGVATLAPAALMMMTSFTRFLVVLLLTRNALGVSNIPPSQVLIGLSLFLTLFSMGPIFNQINHQALEPALHKQISWSVAAKKGYAPLATYMESQVNMSDVDLFTQVAGESKPKTAADVSPRVLVPAFVLSELRRAFLIGFIVYIPFLVIDLVVSSSLMSLGMVMLPPAMISLPLKLLLFVLVDGWGLLIRSLLIGAKGG